MVEEFPILSSMAHGLLRPASDSNPKKRLLNSSDIQKPDQYGPSRNGVFGKIHFLTLMVVSSQVLPSIRMKRQRRVSSVRSRRMMW